jgi:hypothetical protein
MIHDDLWSLTTCRLTSWTTPSPRSKYRSRWLVAQLKKQTSDRQSTSYPVPAPHQRLAYLQGQPNSKAAGERNRHGVCHPGAGGREIGRENRRDERIISLEAPFQEGRRLHHHHTIHTGSRLGVRAIHARCAQSGRAPPAPGMGTA